MQVSDVEASSRWLRHAGLLRTEGFDPTGEGPRRTP